LEALRGDHAAEFAEIEVLLAGVRETYGNMAALLAGHLPEIAR